MGKVSSIPPAASDQWETQQELRDRFLDKLSSKDLYDVHQHALAEGWGFTEVRSAIDDLLKAKAAELGEDLPR